MKMMKKIFALVLVAAMLLTMLPVVGAANEPAIAIGSGTVNIENGAATVQVPITIANNPGFAGMDLSISIPEGWSITDINGAFLEDDAEKYSIFCEMKSVSIPGIGTVQVPTPFVAPEVNKNYNGTNTGRFVAAYGKADITTNGTICWVTYSVPAGTINGSYDIAVTSNKINTLAATGVDISDGFVFTKGKITVEGGVNVSDYVPQITLGTPADASATYDGTTKKVTLTVDAKQTAAGNVTYQWYSNTVDSNENGSIILGATGASYEVTLTTPGTESYYYCVVTGSAYDQTATSRAAKVTYNKATDATAALLSYTLPETSEYNDTARVVNVTPKTGITGLGTITVKYNGSTEAPKNAGTYNVTVDIAAGTNYGAITGLSLGSFTINKVKVEVPTAAQNLIYNGTAQTGVENISQYAQRVSGADIEQTDAGNYSTMIALKNTTNYEWVDGTIADKRVAWSISKAKVAEPTAVTGLVYTGSAQVGVENVNAQVQTSDATSQTNAGTHTVTYTLKDSINYEWASGSDGVVTFTIAKADVTITASDLTIVKGYSSPVGATASGAGNDLTSALTYNIAKTGITMEGTTVKVAESVDVGNYDLVITYVETANYKAATKTVKVNVIAKELCEVTLPQTLESKDYTGTAFNVSDFIGAPTNNGTGENGAYTYYLNGAKVENIATAKVTNAGTYTVTVKYEDTKNVGEDSVTFKINPKKVAAPTADSTVFTYTGETLTYTVAASDAYTVTGNKQTNAGEYEVVVALKDKVNTVWADSETAADKTFTFTINKKEIAVPAKDNTSFTYNGSEQTYNVTATNDYTVSGNKQTAAGEYEVTITLKDTANTVWADNKKADAKVYDWTIAPKTVTATIEIASGSVYDNGKAQKPAVTVKDGETVIPAGEYTLTYSNNTGAGTATVTITDNAKGNYVVSGTKNFEIAKAEMDDATIEASYKYKVSGVQTLDIAGIPDDAGEVTYTVSTPTGSDIFTAKPTAADEKITLNLKGMDAFVQNTKATFTVTVKMDNYEDKVVSVTINITERDYPTISAQAINKTYNGQAVTAADIKGTAKFDNKDVAGTWSFVGASEMKNAGTYENVTVKFTPNDLTTYGEVTTKITVTIKKADVTGAPEFTKVTSTGKTLADVEVKLDKLVPAGGTFAWKDASDTKVEANKKYAWTYTVTGDNAANYNVLEGETVLYAYNPVPVIPTQNIKIDETSKGGTITVAVGSTTYGSTVNFTVKAENGYVLEKLSIVDAKGNEIKYTVKADGTFSFVMPNSSVTIVPTYKWSNPFTDVSEKQWYFDAVKYAYQNGLMSGMSNTVFGVGTETTRAMIITILWRLEGAPVVNYLMRFNDVASETWYTEAVRWAASEKIVSGMSTTEFAPTASITREQLAVMLYNYAQYKGYDVSVGENTNILSFGDTQKLSSWAIPAVQWACGSGLMSGLPANGTLYLAPQGGAMREQAASMLMRFVEGNK